MHTAHYGQVQPQYLGCHTQKMTILSANADIYSINLCHILLLVLALLVLLKVKLLMVLW